MLRVRMADPNVYERHSSNSIMHAKTPGRPLVSNYSRMLLKENATEKQTAKGKRPAHPTTPAHPNQKFDSAMKTGSTTALRLTALVDKTNKTPFRSRFNNPVTPVPSGKLHSTSYSPAGDISLLGTIMRPSATRKSLRVPRSASKSFETPMAQGRKPYWDISDGNINTDMGPPLPTSDTLTPIEEDNDEVEYMPPPGPDEVFHPGFEVPDYQILGYSLSIFSGFHWNSMPIDDDASSLDSVSDEIPIPDHRILRSDVDDPFPTPKSDHQNPSAHHMGTRAKSSKTLQTPVFSKVSSRQQVPTKSKGIFVDPSSGRASSKKFAGTQNVSLPGKQSVSKGSAVTSKTCGTTSTSVGDLILLGTCSKNHVLPINFVFEIEGAK